MYESVYSQLMKGALIHNGSTSKKEVGGVSELIKTAV